MKIIRFILGKVLLFLNFLTRPKKIYRSDESKIRIRDEAQLYSLYQFAGCPFCIKVRRAMHRLDLPIELRDSTKDPYRSELEKATGKVQAPCLKIEEKGEVRWMYESSDIISYLEKRFVEYV